MLKTQKYDVIQEILWTFELFTLNNDSMNLKIGGYYFFLKILG